MPADKDGGSCIFKKLFDRFVSIWAEYEDFMADIQEPCVRPQDFTLFFLGFSQGLPLQEMLVPLPGCSLE